jgi:thiol-disulfide isomerase/thioredoxin
MNKKTLLIILGLAIFAFAWYKYRTPRFITGEKAPDFETTLPTGEKAHLSDLKGKFVLLQFWGSWCGPCRMENPALGLLYQKYHASGFEIFSIGVERNQTSWQRAIQHDGMVWKYHAADFKEFDGEIPRLFNIHSIPATFLINREGMIVGVNLPPAEMDQKLAQTLTN